MKKITNEKLLKQLENQYKKSLQDVYERCGNLTDLTNFEIGYAIEKLEEYYSNYFTIKELRNF
jgi:hypothetical protein